VIKLESVHIEEVRGIRKLDLDFRCEKFAISGPNGSGKSGVIDAIEFGLTGNIGRLTGRGTKGLSVAEHGPHVDKSKFPDAAFVTLKVRLPSLEKSATITRKVNAPHKPKIEPADADIVAALQEVANHPEITLSRREILRFILVEPTKRSEEIQTILRLDQIGQTRSALNAAQNKLSATHKTATTQLQTARNALLTHVGIPALKTDELLAAVNERRAVLALPAITELRAETKLDAGLSETAKPVEFNKQSALRDMKALAEAARGFPALASEEVGAIIASVKQLEDDPALFSALQRRTFLERGLELTDGPECPLCDRPWGDQNTLRAHLKQKLAKSEQARKIQETLASNGSIIAKEAIKITGLLPAVRMVAQVEEQDAFAQLLGTWKVDLEALKARIGTVDGVIGEKERFTKGWSHAPEGLEAGLTALRERLEAKPDQSATLDAQTFLTKAQVRLGDYREAMRKSAAAERVWKDAKLAHDTYCSVMEEELNSLYDEVQKDFSTFYRAINANDESTFTAKLTPSEGSLGLDVNFFERGLFPPAAYHSEGHQDGMGVCLYLALMKRLYGAQFTFALLDDIVMSVDTGHRYEFCKLLKTYFPETQFIITTHDRLWAEQMRSAGLVTSKTSIAFHSWTINTGPLVESNIAIWEEIDAALAKGKVEVAAAALRHHLEYISRLLADQLGAAPQFRADGNYELGELLPAVLKRIKELYGKAESAAHSWGQTADKAAAADRKTLLATSNGATQVEQWAVNKAVHYNEWANFGKTDFQPVLAAYKELLTCFACGECGSWLYVTPRANAESLRCSCNAVSMNLKARSK
jgi:hypothetical protein